MVLYLSLSEVLEQEELKRIKKICEEKQRSPEQLVEEKVVPLQKRISEHDGELISAITRSYKDTSIGGLLDSTPQEQLHVGIITKETRFPRFEKNETLDGFLNNIKNPYFAYLKAEDTILSTYGKNVFSDWNTFYHYLIYFMQEPPLAPQDPIIEIKKQRLELFIGDSEAIPILEENLAGHQFVWLSKQEGYNLPITEKIGKKIENEQLKIFEEIRAAEEELQSLTKTRDRRIAYSNQADGVIDHGIYLELTDEFVEKLKYNPKIRDAKESISWMMKTAIERGYHESGRRVTKKLDSGISMQIDLREFFSQRKEKYKL